MQAEPVDYGNQHRRSYVTVTGMLPAYQCFGTDYAPAAQVILRLIDNTQALARVYRMDDVGVAGQGRGALPERLRRLFAFPRSIAWHAPIWQGQALAHRDGRKGIHGGAHGVFPGRLRWLKYRNSAFSEKSECSEKPRRGARSVLKLRQAGRHA